MFASHVFLLGNSAQKEQHFTASLVDETHSLVDETVWSTKQSGRRNTVWLTKHSQQRLSRGPRSMPSQLRKQNTKNVYNWKSQQSLKDSMFVSGTVPEVDVCVACSNSRLTPCKARPFLVHLSQTLFVGFVFAVVAFLRQQRTTPIESTIFVQVQQHTTPMESTSPMWTGLFVSYTGQTRRIIIYWRRM